MKTSLLLTAAACVATAQDPGMIVKKLHAEAVTAVGVGEMMGGSIKGAPYSATIVTEMVQTLADGNRIVQKNQGAVARDSQGRMRHEAVLPVIGTMAADAAPKMVFINDPVAGVSYNLNPAEKSYREMKAPGSAMLADKLEAERKAGTMAGSKTMTFQVRTNGPAEGMRMVAPPPDVHVEVHHDPGAMIAEQMATKEESLGSKVIEGVMVEGTRSVRVIPAGEIGNDRPIEIVSETWISPELKTIVYSKRSDPRTGDRIYSLTNINRAEPDRSLFSVPADYKVSSGKPSDVIIYKQKED